MKKSRNILTIIILIVLSLISSYLLSTNSLSYSYSWLDEAKAVDITDFEHVYENVDYDIESGIHTPLNDDPWIMFNNINHKYSGVLIKLKQKADSSIPVKLYYTQEGSDALSERNTIEIVINKGMDTGYIKLPAMSINIIRLDIDAECIIESISLSEGKIAKRALYDNAYALIFIIKFFIIFIVLYFAFLYHKERVSKGSKVIKGIFINDASSLSEHRYELDYIRTLAAILVIMMHSVIESFAPQVSIGEPGYLTLKMFLALSLVCNVLFIMLSGSLLLKPKDETIGQFYKKRLGKVLIPTISYYLLYMLQGYPSEVFKDGLGNGLKEIGLGLLTSRPKYMLHMWFIYAILGLYILAPFLRILIRHINEGQLLGLIITGFICDIFASTLPYFKLSFGIETPLSSWMGVFLLGYYITTDHAKKHYRLFMCLGVIGLIVTCLSVYYHPEYLYYESNWAPMMWLEGAAVFAFFSYFKKFFGKKNFIVLTIAKYNFSIMLVHVLLLMKFILPTGWRLQAQYGHLSIFIVMMILVCFILSYVVSVIYDNTAIAAANYIYSKIINRNK